MRLTLAYGRHGLDVEIPGGAMVVEPRDAAPLGDERAAFVAAVRSPIEATPLRETVQADNSVVIVTSDVTRATPNERLIPWILDELAHVPAHRITVVIGTGSHRGTTATELEQMFGRAVLERVRIVDHDAHDPGQSALAGTTARGTPVFLSKRYLEADRRIVVGFIEPHVYAGFSGGSKGVMPGVAGIETVQAFHDARNVGDPRSTWLAVDGNPTAAMSREAVAMAPPDFIVNVTLDRARRITGFFCGDYLAAHSRGTAFCRSTSAREVDARHDVVLATNGGYPLDQNLYQCIKGLSVANLIVKPGGTIVLCAECSDGLPEHGNFKELIRARSTPHELLAMIEEPGFSVYDQWAAQSTAMVLANARVCLKSTLPDTVVRAAMLEPVDDVARAVADALASAGPGATCAVLPEGPYVVPYLRETVTA